MSEKRNIRAVIIDDSRQARKLLRLMLLEIAPDIVVAGEAEDVEEGLRLIDREQPDAVFLDIEMPGRTGLQLAQEVKNKNFKGRIIFATAYNAYAIQAFRLSALDYLLKPIQEDHLLEAVQKLRNEQVTNSNSKQLEALTSNLDEEQENTICVPVQGGYEYIPLKDICCFEADGSYVRIICQDNKQKVVAKNLKYFENALETMPRFVRPHRSYLVNMDQVIAYSKSDGGSLALSNGTQVPVSRERKQLVQEFLK